MWAGSPIGAGPLGYSGEAPEPPIVDAVDVAVYATGGIAYAGFGAVSATVAAAPVTAIAAGIGGMSYAGIGSVAITVANPTAPTVTAYCAATGGMLYAGIGAVTATVAPILQAVTVTAAGQGGMFYAGIGAVYTRDGSEPVPEALYVSIACQHAFLSIARI